MMIFIPVSNFGDQPLHQIPFNISIFQFQFILKYPHICHTQKNSKLNLEPNATMVTLAGWNLSRVSQGQVGVAQNKLYWHHSSLNLAVKVKRFFPFRLVPKNPTRGHQRFRCLAGEYKCNSNRNKTYLLVTSLCARAFCKDTIYCHPWILIVLILLSQFLLNCIRVLEGTDCRPTDQLCFKF